MIKKINNLIKLAKAKYGEPKQEFIGYKVGDYWFEGWEWDDDDLTTLITQEQMESFIKDENKLNDIVGITMEELNLLLTTNDDYNKFQDNIVVMRCYKVLNKGWKRKLIDFINNYIK